ncbi:hypothetical protein ACFQT0_10835 [Hymenobacter humi]|uniref:Uncharacterized protein n=1 Tax=Hymenobacter humi TaxID=1411620 RepID=A0ABW2U4K9_9BACT
MPDAINKTEEAQFHAGFGLARASDKVPGKGVATRCGYKFNAFFYDEDSLTAVQSVDRLLFHFSSFSAPMRRSKDGRLEHMEVDSEWQETILFQLPLENRFRYVDKDLLKLKLSAVHSAYGALESGTGRYFIQKGVVEGRRINDSVYDVRIDARYLAVMSDTTFWVPVWVDARFKRQRGFDKPWEYQCSLFEKGE